MSGLCERIGIGLPIVQAPMAGVSTPAMAAAVSNAGALGSIAVGAVDVERARAAIAAARAATARPFGVNVFCHRPAVADAAREAAWSAYLRPHFAAVGAEPPATLREIYRSYLVDDAMQALLLAERPAVVSFHFGVPPPAHVGALRAAGILTLASATNLGEAQTAVDAGVDAVIAQGFEAGGHRGVFDPSAPDACLGTLALTRLCVAALPVPVIAAGGIMDGAGIAAALAAGAAAAQLGTAFVACPESEADAGFRATLASPAAHRTTMTRAVSGRPARCLANRFTALGEATPAAAVPDYPIAYDAAKALHAAAKARGEWGWGAQWAGQGAPLARVLPAAALVARLAAEVDAAAGALSPVRRRE
ncbi:MAG: nitronate monooxygenase [bacterium]|nr:nitronate monooxygenase [bacterium]